MRDEALDLREFLTAFYRWWWVFLALPLLIGAITAGTGLTSPSPAPKYQATATMLLEGGASTANYPSLVVTRPMLKGAIDQFALPLSVDEIEGAVSARLVPETQFLEVRATNSEPARARTIADAVAASLDLQIRFLRPVKLDGRKLTVSASVRHSGRTIRVAEAEVFDADSRRVALASGSSMVIRGGIEMLKQGISTEEIVRREGRARSI
ncbi:MAG: hypothetical protein IH994_08185 [Proteobacteria bacterium]|nr:hypothetical protein [Pseudomonadota bacterium]